jgi:hypothetical protein
MAAGPNDPGQAQRTLLKPVYANRLQQAERKVAARARKQARYVRSRQRRATRRGSRRSLGFQFIGKTGVNTVGGLREGQRYRVFNRNGVFYHVYGYGPEARKVRLRPEVARQYGYTGNKMTPGMKRKVQQRFGGNTTPNPY